LRYKNTVKAVFISRPNRFTAVVELCGRRETVHVKNTGRCAELLVEGVTVWLSRSDNPLRKTAYDLVAVEKNAGGRRYLVNIDSQAVNDAAGEFLRNGNLFSENAVIRREMKYRNSRFDFYIEDGERKVFLEAKGVTLEREGKALFPDAPTERGVKHINELVSALGDGYECIILFVVQMKGVTALSPNYQTHKEFGEALRTAEKAGVRIMAFDCIITEDTMEIDQPINVVL